MIWFDIKKIEKNLVDGNVSDKESMNYLLVILIFSAVGHFISANNFENKWLMLIEVIVFISILVILLRTAFNINTNGDGKDFLKRYIALSLVVKIRLIVFTFFAVPFVIFLVMIGKLSGIGKIISNDILTVSFSIIINIIYYFMLRNSFRRVNMK
jgi:hypothetical protein